MGAAESKNAASSGAGGASKDGTVKFAAMLAAVETATTPSDLQVVVKDVTAADVASISLDQAKVAFDTLSAALVAVDPAASDAKVKALQTLAADSTVKALRTLGTDSKVKALRTPAGGVKQAILRLLVTRVVDLHAASGYKPVADMIKSIQNLLAARRDSGESGGAAGGGGGGGGAAQKYVPSLSYVNIGKSLNQI